MSGLLFVPVTEKVCHVPGAFVSAAYTEFETSVRKFASPFFQNCIFTHVSRVEDLKSASALPRIAKVYTPVELFTGTSWMNPPKPPGTQPWNAMPLVPVSEAQLSWLAS